MRSLTCEELVDAHMVEVYTLMQKVACICASNIYNEGQLLRYVLLK